MPLFERHCDVIWEGSIREGKGEAIAGTGAFKLPVTFPARVEQPGGKTSPEELIAAAHAACYAMALTATMGRRNASARRVKVTATMGRRNASARRVKVTATIEAEFEAGIKITASHLKVIAEGLQGVTAADFPQLVRDAEQACPVSNALRGSLKIDVQAQAV